MTTKTNNSVLSAALIILIYNYLGVDMDKKTYGYKFPNLYSIDILAIFWYIKVLWKYLLLSQYIFLIHMIYLQIGDKAVELCKIKKKLENKSSIYP